MRFVCFSIGTKDGHIYDRTVQGLRKEGHDIEVIPYDHSDIDGDVLRTQSFLKEVSECDLLILRVHGDISYFKGHEKLVSVIEKYDVDTLLTGTEPEDMDRYRRYYHGDDTEYTKVRNMGIIGGDANFRHMLEMILNRKEGACFPDEEIDVPVQYGYYHPDKGTVPLKEAMEKIDGSKPVIAVIFPPKFIMTRNLQSIDGLVRALENRGAYPLPVFTYTKRDDVTGSIGLKAIYDECFVKDGRPIVDCVIQTSGFSQLLVGSEGNGVMSASDNYFRELGVPEIQTMSMYTSEETWRESIFGLSISDLAMCVVHPEFDGQIITVPFAAQKRCDDGYRFLPIDERCEAVADMAYRWAELRRIPNKDKKVSILIYMYPPRQDLAGGATGLDTIQSVVNMLSRLKDEGYTVDWVPETSKELVDRLLSGVTNDHEHMTDEVLSRESPDLITRERYMEWYDGLAQSIKDGIEKNWGEPPGTLHTVDGKQLIPGFINGNIFVGFQPDRGKTDAAAIHDPFTHMPHQYVGVYRWLRDDFMTDAVIHVGTHGTLEWLPGKSAGLSDECSPDAVLKNVPNIYPYIIDNPGEGMQAKRRSYAVDVTYMIPSMTRADTYGDMGPLITAIQSYKTLVSYEYGDKIKDNVREIAELVRKLDLQKDIHLPEDFTLEELEPVIDDIYDYILETKDAMIPDGLHIFGDVPEGDRMVEMIYSLVRLANGDVPSLRSSVADCMGYDLDRILDDITSSTNGKPNGVILDDVDEATFRIIRECRDSDFDMCHMEEYVRKEFNGSEDILKVVGFICSELKDGVLGISNEMDSLVDALNGGYVIPGPSGCPTRGRADLLPTGTNFYSLDPDTIPWKASWDVGVRMADQMLSRYLDEKGMYPKSLGIIIWATDTMRTGGDDIAYVLWLMGLRPIWSEYGGRVTGLEVIPAKELGRPRIDVTLRASGLFRDTFPNLMELIDDGVRMIADLDESEEENYLAASIRRDLVEQIGQGIPPDEARRLASVRIFSDAPGQYGCGISDLISNGDWKDVRDLGGSYVMHGCYVYGKGLKGEAHPEMFRKRLQSMDVTVKNHNNRENDLLDCDDDFDSLGGFNAAVRTFSDKIPESYIRSFPSDDIHLLKIIPKSGPPMWPVTSSYEVSCPYCPWAFQPSSSVPTG